MCLSRLLRPLPWAVPLVLSCLFAGCAQVPTGTAPLPAHAARNDSGTLRLGVVQWLRENREEEEVIVPPVYSNHLPKTLTYETLVVVDNAGRPQPGLAERWEADP